MARWDSCNVLETTAAARHLWQFNARGGEFVLAKEQVRYPGEPLPPQLIKKDWRSIFKKKLNVAWLAPENVFIRVAQFPRSSFDETRSMVEFQLEKLSPIPVTQAVWAMHILPHSEGNMQTVIVIIAARTVVEEFLGKLEEQGFLADRLELPMLDQLQSTKISGDGAWVYPDAGKHSALVAWWSGGVLRNVDLLSVQPGPNRVASVRDQLLQMAWAGELEGWLTAPPRWHLVADSATAGEWESALRESMEQPVQVSAPLSAPQLAALTAKRAAKTESKDNLLPGEFATRYRQRFVDRLWMRGLGVVIGLYLACVMVYFVATNILNFRTEKVELEARSIAGSYTNSLQLKARYQVLKDRQELKFAGLDCWRLTAEFMPENLTLESMNFSDGQKLALNGTAPANQDVLNFSDKIRKATVNGKLFFDPASGDSVPMMRTVGGTTTWSFSLQLKRGEDE